MIELQGGKEVLLINLRTDTVELGDMSRLEGQMIDRMIVLSTVSMSGLCWFMLVPHNRENIPCCLHP